MNLGFLINMFTDKEINLLNSITEGFSKEAKHAYLQSFDEFMNDWYNFVEKVERGYSMTIDDYTNDLTKRDLIAKLLEQVPDTLKNKVNALVDPWDKRFDKATNALKSPIFGEGNKPWWKYRIPKKLTGDLQEDIIALKIK